MKKTITLVTSVAAAIAIILTVIVTAALYHGVYEESVSETLSEELNMVASLCENGIEPGNLKTKMRVTVIRPDGSVEYDSFAKADDMVNHLERKEVREAIEDGWGSDERQSDTLSVKQIYRAQRISDGRVVRLSRDASTLIAFFGMVAGPAIALIIVLFILMAFASALVSSRIVAPINTLNLDEPEENDVYEEISPLLMKISRQKRDMEAEIQDKERTRREFEFITSSLSEGLVVVGKDGRILSFNRSADLLMGSVLKNGEYFLSFLSEDGMAEALLSSLDGRDGEKVAEKDGRMVEFSFHSSLGGAVVLLRDVTEKYEREKLRREFTANVSHELKTPITSILGFSELLKEGGLPQSTVSDFACEINREALRLKDTVSDIISLSYLDEGRMDESEEVNLVGAVEDELDKLKLKVEEKNINVEVCIPEDIVLTLPKKSFSEVLSNLLGNAVRYNKDGGTITVSARRVDGEVRICVHDTGIGISSSDLPRIFERFYRADKGRSRESGGTGLGLSIVKNSVGKMGGRVDVESREGEGSTFTVTLPQ